MGGNEEGGGRGAEMAGNSRSFPSSLFDCYPFISTSVLMLPYPQPREIEKWADKQSQPIDDFAKGMQVPELDIVAYIQQYLSGKSEKKKRWWKGGGKQLEGRKGRREEVCHVLVPTFPSEHTSACLSLCAQVRGATYAWDDNGIV